MWGVIPTSTRHQIGEIYSYELTTNGIDFTKQSNKNFIHTNHILSQKLSNKRMFDDMYK
ncbi:MAG: hypothetical protein K2P14_08155 [Anaeroplasmataceae bacterium]|nr:hypothetical protein [Anaeroplasmataceae bacterium]